MRICCYCTAEAYKMEGLAKSLRNLGLSPKFYDEVICIKKFIKNSKAEGVIFYFPYGCVITWGIEQSEITSILNYLKAFEINSLDVFCDDSATYSYNPNGKTEINEEKDQIVLESKDTLIELAISHALSQSVKLSSFEESVLRTIKRTRRIPQELSQKGKISLSRTKLAKKIGDLFIERNFINLHTDILETPEFFWRRPKYEPYYIMAARYMDIATRHNILNKRLDVIHELYGILSNEINHKHSSRLELIIIYLIMVEVVLVIMKDLLHLF